MTSTPVSLNDESLNGSWIDINSASQIHSPMSDDSPEFMAPSYSLAESVQNLGLISFQVERFLQEAQKNNSSNTNANNNINAAQPVIADNISDLYLSDSDISAADGQFGQTFMNKLETEQQKQRFNSNSSNNNNINNNNILKHNNQLSSDVINQRLSKSGDCLFDQVSDSLSLLSRASVFGETALDQAASFQDFDWLWDWTAQPEYFAGQEWKVCAPKQDYLMRQRQLYCANLGNNPGYNCFSGDMMSLLFLTNILSIIIGAGLTYSILMRRSTV